MDSFLVYLIAFMAIIACLYLLIFEQKKKKNSSIKTVEYDLTGYTHYEEFDVVGFTYDDKLHAVLNFCNLHYPIELEHEQENEYSDNAVKVLCDGIEIGYISEDYSEEVLDIITGKYTSFISVYDIDPSWIDIKIKIFFIQNSL
tara:strand:- start:184 stop:615 length:432 start_codon:yes stop_codon:yes gene_type:complete